MVLIKRYPNRKLYNTESKQYIKLEEIADLIRQGDEIQVTDHVTGEDLTALTLTQIILEQEKRQSGVLTSAALLGLIRSGGDRLHALQRGFISSINGWLQIDEEIERRIQALVDLGELDEVQGKTLLDTLVKQGARMREEHRAKGIDMLFPIEKIEAFFQQRQIPTQEDIRRLNKQLEELAAKIEEIAELHSDA